jgi:hypothetical protein
MIVNGRVSETERIWVDEEGLINRSRLKIQSIPLWKHRGTRVHIPIKKYANATQVNNKTRNIIKNYKNYKIIKIINNDKIINN